MHDKLEFKTGKKNCLAAFLNIRTIENGNEMTKVEKIRNTLIVTVQIVPAKIKNKKIAVLIQLIFSLR